MESRTWGYARVSTKEQNLDRQLIALMESGVEERNIITDKESGKDLESITSFTATGPPAGRS